MANPHNLQVGQKLFAVATQSYSGKADIREFEIAKIGRKWATTTGLRPKKINLETLRSDGGQYISRWRCYLSEAEYRDEQARNDAWSAIYRQIPQWGHAPSMDDIRAIARIFGLEKYLDQKLFEDVSHI